MLVDGTAISTRELWARLFRAPTIGGYLDENGQATLPPFSDFIAQLAAERELKREEIAAGAGLERTYGHRLFNGTRNPSRDTVLQLAFGLRLSADEAQHLLEVAQKSPLHPKVGRDAVVAWHLHNGRSLMDAQQALYENGLPLLGSSRRG